MTCAGRITRSCSMKPSRTTSARCRGACPVAGMLQHGLVQVRIERLAQGFDPRAVVLASTLSSCCLTSLKPSSRPPPSADSSGGVDRALHIVQHRQQVGQQAQVGIAALVVQFAAGPLAKVLPLGLQSQGAVSGLRRIPCASSAASLADGVSSLRATSALGGCRSGTVVSWVASCF